VTTSGYLKVGAVLGVALGMAVILLDLHLAWFTVAAVVVAACPISGWVLDRKE
jgi:hypothetical protein